MRDKGGGGGSGESVSEITTMYKKNAIISRSKANKTFKIKTKKLEMKSIIRSVI